MPAYYNEWEPYAAFWLRNLILAGHLPPGDVDERDIRTVSADDLKGYTECHFFAGIGGWPLALRMAGWDYEIPVWTGSCPCQPFSVAGKGRAQADDRHLWPAWFRLIRECRPAVIFGEQVTGALAHGWWDDAADDLESAGYAAAAAVLPACSVGAPHKRDRLWFVADRTGGGRFQGGPDDGRPREEYREKEERRGPADGDRGDAVADTDNTGLQGRKRGELPQCSGEQFTRESGTSAAYPDGQPVERPSVSWDKRGFWQSEPAVGRVADGIPARSHKLRAYGNAIVPQVAAEFIAAAMRGMERGRYTR